MTTYTFNPQEPWSSASLTRSDDNAVIPLDLGNRDYQGFLDWLSEGNAQPQGWTGPTNTTPATVQGWTGTATPATG